MACTQSRPPPCPSDMGYIKVEGQILLGELHPTENWHLPQQHQPISSFCMDRYEYPNKKGTLPLAQVSWTQASQLCKKQNKRLCREAEWEYACRGVEQRKYGYGDQKKSKTCNSDATSPQEKVLLSPSGAFSNCKTPEGIYDLNGNVSEWVEDDWRAFDHNQKRWKTKKEHKTLRGGTLWSQTHYGQDCTSRHAHHFETWQNRDDGFRCCLSIAQEP